MNLVEKLMQADITKCAEKEKDTIQSRRLAKILGQSEPVEVEVTEVDQRLLNEILADQFDRKGRFEPAKAYDAQLRCLVEGIASPPMKDKKLMEHFGCHTPKELAEKLFKGEAKKIADRIAELSGVESENEEDEAIKN